jgi:hypothetical protein
MTARGPDDHGDLSDRYDSEPVPEHDAPGSEPAARAPLETLERLCREGRVRLVEERVDPTAPHAVRAHAAGEQHDAAEILTVERGHRGRDRERSSREANRHPQPPP